MIESNNATPIKPVVPAVFIYVTNIRKSAEWYGRLLGLPVADTTREDLHIFDLSDHRSSNLFLKKREAVHPSQEPLYSLTAPDCSAALRFLTAIGAEIVHEDEEVIHFKDPDGNMLMACSI